MNRVAVVLAGVAAGLMSTAVSPGCKRASRPESEQVVVYTSVDQVFAEPVLLAYKQQSGVEVRTVYDTEETKSTGVLNRLLAESETPRADVFWSGDPIRPQILITRGLVAPHVSASAEDIPAAFRAADGAWTGFSARARVILINTERVPDGERPDSIRDYLDPRWKDSTALANPAFGTTTTHIAALFEAWGDEEGRAFLAGLRENGVRVAASNGEVKRLVAAGEVAWGVVDTDDAAVAVESGAPVAVIFPDAGDLGTLVIPTAVVRIAGGPNPEPSKALVDYLVSAEVERMLADAACRQMPLRAGVPTPPGVRSVSEIEAMAVDYPTLGDTVERLHPGFVAWAEGTGGP
ncbi:MAG: extracellular solute-binding protein [Myxococcota bacterium]|jgi:iron(III) transport system substrate-binding protein|nr:extracellular solute-binding protein [Myxococcota bacterium]